MTCPDPEKLCKYYQSGTAKDFESFVQNSEVWIFRKARDLIRGSVPGKYELAEDVTWIVIEKVCDSRESKPWLPEKGSLKNWLYSLIRNQIASYLRVKSNQMRPFSDYLRENEVGELCSIEQQQVDERAIPPLEAMIQAERLEQARALFAQLPPLTRQVVTLYYDEGLTFRQIAAEIGTHTSSVFRHVASAREKFALLVASERLAA